MNVHNLVNDASLDEEIAKGDRFEFGKNWKRFLSLLTEERVREAENSLRYMLEIDTLDGKTFLDVGSGSGLFSLAAKRLGAKVVSFDYDPQSVHCTKELKGRYCRDDKDWTVEQGSILDTSYVKSLGHFDVVYSWGVLHHTGDMWAALENVDLCVADSGKLFIALYNYQPFASRYWAFVKKLYNKKTMSRWILLVIHTIWPTLPSVILRKIQGRKYPRGMSPWCDLKDWLGGYPFEVSKPEEVLSLKRRHGYTLSKLATVGGKRGCNEYVFERNRQQSK